MKFSRCKAILRRSVSSLTLISASYTDASSASSTLLADIITVSLQPFRALRPVSLRKYLPRALRDENNKLAAPWEKLSSLEFRSAHKEGEVTFEQNAAK